MKVSVLSLPISRLSPLTVAVRYGLVCGVGVLGIATFGAANAADLADQIKATDTTVLTTHDNNSQNFFNAENPAVINPTTAPIAGANTISTNVSIDTIMPANTDGANLETVGKNLDTVNKNLDTASKDASNVTTEDVTASPNRSIVATPAIVPNSARTRPSFTPNEKQQNSLERLKQYYQPKPAAMLNNTASPTALNTQPMCMGTWVYPTNKYQQKAALDAAHGDNQHKPNAEFPMYAEADYGYYDDVNYAELSGNVLVTQGRQQISADKVVVNLQDGVGAAQGNVSIVDASDSPDDTSNNKADSKNPTQSFIHQINTSQANANLPNQSPSGVKGGLITMADEVAYQSNNAKSTAKDVAFASVPLQAHGYAKQLNQVDASHYEIQNVMFTTCPPEHPVWQIDAAHVDINSDTGRGYAYNATLKVKNKPIFYLPYLDFPIDNRRSSGVLLPRAGFSSDGGLHVEVPYYFNLAPNYDATLTPNIFSNRNPMMMGEFRYLTQDYGQGQFSGSYLLHDRQYQNADRSSLFFNHHWQSPKYPTLSVDAVYQHVSDAAYFDDFDTLGLLNNSNTVNLPQRLQATYYDDNITALAKVEQFQTLNDTLNNNQTILDKDKPYKRLPQLSLNYKVPWITQFNVTGTSDFAYFKRPINDGSAPEQSGGRLYNRLNASYPIERAWGYVTPMVSLQHLYTQFDEETLQSNGISQDNKSRSIFVPQFSLDAALNFFKAGAPLEKYNSLGGYQLIQPRIKYVYAPYKDQSSVPNFATQFASLNFPQLFEDSWFLGYDRLADSHFVTPAVNYRYIDGQGLTRLDASIGKQIFLSDIRVHLDNTNTPIKVNSSGTVVQVSTQPRKNLWADFDGAITDSNKLGYYNLQLRYQPNSQSLYNLGFIKRNDNLIGQKALSAITASAIVPINESWRFLGSAQYDQIKSRYSDVLVGVGYESCCYGLSIYGRSYYNDLTNTTKPTRAIMAEISLSGIANKRDGRLATLMNDRVIGLNNVNRF